MICLLIRQIIPFFERISDWRERVIDSHVHCFPPKLADRALHGTLADRDFEVDGTLERQLVFAKKAGIRRFLLLNFASRPENMAHVNEFAVESNGKDGLVISFGSVHPFAPDALQELDRLYERGIRGIKFQPIRQSFSMDDPRCRPVFARIGELGMMTVIHGGRSARTREYPVLPEHVAKYIDCFQGNSVVLSHMGGMFLTRKEIDAAAALPVITDTAYSAYHMDLDAFAYAFERFGVERVMFGTDMPWADLTKEKAYVDSLRLSPDDRERVYDGNAEHYLSQCGAWL